MSEVVHRCCQNPPKWKVTYIAGDTVQVCVEHMKLPHYSRGILKQEEL